MFFNIHLVNLKQVRAVVQKYGVCWFHGDGNFYRDEVNSNFRKGFTNPGRDNSLPSAAYRVKFTNVDDVPNTIQAMEKRLYAAKMEEDRQDAIKRQNAGQLVDSISVDDLENEDLEKGEEVKVSKGKKVTA